MSKQAKSPRIADSAAAPPAAAPEPAPAAPASTAEAATPATPQKTRGVGRRLLAAALERLRGTRLERLAKGASDAAAKAPARLERELDAALDRLGLVRKSKAQGTATAGAPAPKAA